MIDKKCEHCYYYGNCPECDVCEDYTPINEQTVEDEIDELIENTREDFRTTWFEYIGYQNN